MKELLEILSPVLGDELARDIIAHRKGLKCPLTPRGARSLLKQYELTGKPIEAAEEHLNRGWQGFKAEWVMKGAMFQDSRNPSVASESRDQRISRHVLTDEYRFARDSGDHESAARIRERMGAVN